VLYDYDLVWIVLTPVMSQCPTDLQSRLDYQPNYKIVSSVFMKVNRIVSKYTDEWPLGLSLRILSSSWVLTNSSGLGKSLFCWLIPLLRHLEMNHFRSYLNLLWIVCQIIQKGTQKMYVPLMHYFNLPPLWIPISTWEFCYSGSKLNWLHSVVFSLLSYFL